MDNDPSIAERTRTILAGHLPGRLGLGSRAPLSVPHGTDEAGRPLLLIPDLLVTPDVEGRLNECAVLRVDDVAPLAGAPRYGQAAVSGPVTMVDDGGQCDAADAFATTNPHPDLLDLGRGRSIWRMEVDQVWLDNDGRRYPIDVSDYRAAAPDPLRRVEAQLLADLRDDYPQFAARLLGCVSATAHPAQMEYCRAVRVDRCAVLVDTGASTYLRICLPRPVSDADDFAAVLHPLLCETCYRDPQRMAAHGLPTAPGPH